MRFDTPVYGVVVYCSLLPRAAQIVLLGGDGRIEEFIS